MDNLISKFGKLFLALYVNENILPIKINEIDRSADDLIQEVGRYKKEKRQAEKQFSSVKLQNKIFRDFDAMPPKHEWEIIEMDAYGKQLEIENYQIDTIKACFEIKKMFEGKSFIPEAIQNKLGVSIDYNKISLWDERYIKWRAWAQVLWYFDPIANVKNIQDKMINDKKLYETLDLAVLTSITRTESRGRGLEDVIRVVNPNKGKRGRPLKKKPNLPNCIEIPPIPGIYDSSGMKINVIGMRLAIFAFCNVLKMKYNKVTNLSQHPIIKSYKSITSPLFELVIDSWVQEALEGF